MTDVKAAPSRRRLLVVAIVALAVVILVAAAWVGIRALLAKSELEAAAPLVDDIRTSALEGDLEEVTSRIAAVENHASSAASLTDDPVWRAAESLPWLGSNLAAVRVVSSELDHVASTLPPLVASLSAIADGDAEAVIDVAALAAAAPPLREAAESLATAAERLASLDTSSLLPAVAEGAEKMRQATDVLAPAVASAADVAATLPPTLGSDGPRTILLTLQNTAELRTGGGITGTFVELRAEEGRLTLVRQADSSSFDSRATSIAPVPDSTTTVYSNGVGRYVQNTSMAPDFGTTAELASAWWRELTGSVADTVVSVDPFVLEALVRVVGPVSIAGGGEIHADDLIETLLVDSYRDLDQDQQSALFATAVDAVFSRVSQGGLDPLALIRAMSEPVSEGRISAWSVHDDENDVFRAGQLGGPVARQDLAGDGAFAVYFNDATGGKLAPYLDVSLSASIVDCRSDGLVDVAVTIAASSTAPADLGSMPFSVTGGGHFGIRPGDIAVDVAVSAPRDAFVGAVTVGGAKYPAPAATVDEHPSTAARVELAPGETKELEYRFTVRAEDAAALQLLHTPLMSEPEISVSTGCA
ncbi:DUF4012 domain-containing protein [Microbacterium sp. NPDC057407]|uniref:DUF4012 domain-containing protein n=1 Tax=Microbacterium sp. NPDC057407 TaxID=3346120 RepID=UPI003672B5BA